MPRLNPRRLGALVAGLWAGLLLGTALIGTPAGFALAPRELAGRLAGFMLEREATTSLVLGVVSLLIVRALARDDASARGRSVLSTEVLLVLGALFCTVFGYHGLQPLMASARAGLAPVSFGVLHGVSVGFFGLKTLLVIALAWRLSAPSP